MKKDHLRKKIKSNLNILALNKAGISVGLDRKTGERFLFYKDHFIRGMKTRLKSKAPKKSFEVENFLEKSSIRIRSTLGSLVYTEILCPAGSFWMGLGDSEDYTIEYNAYDQFRHRVTLTRPFLMGQTPVKQDLWLRVMGENASKVQGNPNLPASNVSFYDAILFCNRLSELQGLRPFYTFRDESQKDTITRKLFELTAKFSGGQNSSELGPVTWAEISRNPNANGYKLPTAAEWEYVAAQEASAADTFDWKPFDSQYLEKIAWYSSNSISIQPVAQKAENAWGFYDMLGNVLELTEDCRVDSASQKSYALSSSAERKDPLNWIPGKPNVVLRGGSFDRNDNFIQPTSNCISVSPELRKQEQGLRVCRYVS